MTEWLSMETAPKDGETILVINGHGQIKSTAWGKWYTHMRDCWYGHDEVLDPDLLGWLPRSALPELAVNLI